MDITTKLVEIYCIIDDFTKEIEPAIRKHQIDDGSDRKRRNRSSKLSNSEVITILVAFHLGQFKNIKHFYINYIQKHLTSEFPETVSYNRFVELQQQALLPLVLVLKMLRLGEVTGISFTDSTPLRVCNNKRIRRNKVFKDLAAIGRSSMGWFFGFKLHLIINDKGEIINFKFTPGNCDDREPLRDTSYIKAIFGKLFADKGYISQPLWDMLFVNDIQLITPIKKGMKNAIMNMDDKIMLRKRSIIETVNDELKNVCQIEHTRHRSPINFFANAVSAILAYSFLPKKPAIKVETINNFGQLALF